MQVVLVVEGLSGRTPTTTRPRSCTNRFMIRIQADLWFSAGFAPCLDGLARHLDDAQAKVAQLD